MGRYRVQGPDGRIHVIDAPAGASPQEILAFAEANIGYAPPAPAAAAAPAQPKETNFLKDTAGSVISGVGQLLGLPAQLYGLATGDFETPVGDFAKSITDYGESVKSEGMRDLQAGASARIAEADKEGFWSGVQAGLGEYLSDPRLLAAGVAETIPSLFGTVGTGALASGVAKKVLRRELAEQATAKAAQAAVQRAATVGGVGFGAVQQGADVGTDAYVRAMEAPDEVWVQNPDFTARVSAGEDPEAVKADMALDVARMAGLGGAGISALTAGVLPGTFEKAVLGKSLAGQGLLSRAGKGFAGEAVQEATEEGGGAVAQNLALRQVNPEQALLEGAGSQAAIAGLLGGFTGAGSSAAFGGGRAEPAIPVAQPPAAPPISGPEIAPVTAPPSAGLTSILGMPGGTIFVNEEGVSTPYTFNGISDEGHVILTDTNGTQIFENPATLEGVVTTEPTAPIAEPVSGPVAEPIAEPTVEAPGGAAPVGVTQPVSQPEGVQPAPGSTSPLVEGVQPFGGIQPEGIEGETPPVGGPPITPPPAGGTISGTEPIDVTDVGTPTGPQGVAPETTAPIAEDVTPEAIDQVFTQEENLQADVPKKELADALRGKSAPMVADYMAQTAQTPFHRRVFQQVGGMMNALQKQGYRFGFQVVNQMSKPIDKDRRYGEKFSTVGKFKQSNALGAVYPYIDEKNAFRGLRRSDILIRDSNVPGKTSGASDNTVLHEFIHAVTSGVVWQYRRGKVDPKSRVGKAVAELEDIQKKVSQYYKDLVANKVPNSVETLQKIRGLSSNAFENVDELLANGLTDWRMQYLLKQIPVKKTNAFTEFVRTIGRMLGLTEADTNGLRRFLELSEELIPGDVERQIENARIAMGKEKLKPEADVLSKEEGEIGITPGEISEAQEPLVTPDDVQPVVEDLVSDIATGTKAEGDEIIKTAAQPTKDMNETRLDLQKEGQSDKVFSARAMAKLRQISPPISPATDAVGNIGMIGSFLTPASALARTNKYFRAMFDNMNDKLAFRNMLMSRPEKLFAELTKIPQESKDRLNQVMEYLRLSATEIKERPVQFSITTEKVFRDGKYYDPALSKPGDVLKLDKAETDLLYRIQDYLNETYTLNAQSILQAVGYDGEYSLEAIQGLPADTPQDARKRDSFLRLYNAIESQRVTSYIPFMRGGDVRVIIKKTAEDAEGKPKTELAAFYMLDSNQWLREIVGPAVGKLVPDQGLAKKLEELRRKYPEKDGYSIQTTRLAGRIDDKLQLQDLGTLDKLVTLMNANSGKAIKDYFDSTMGGLIDSGQLDDYTKAYAEQIAKGYIQNWPEQIREILMKQIAAGFMKQSENIAGYDTNLVDKLFDYNRIVATTISHRRFRPEYSRAFEEMRANHAPDSATWKYAQAWDQHADTPEHVIWRGARSVGFFNSMWGSFSSSMVNAMSMWNLVAPQMMVMDGAAFGDIYKNSLKLVGAIGLDKNIGAYIKQEKIRGMTPDQREALNWAYQTGVVRAQINPELMGMDAGLLTTKGGKIGAAMKQYFDIGASVVSLTEEMNKVAAFMTAYKYAQQPKALQNWKEAFANNERAKAIMERGSDPREVAAFMTETTTFIGGQLEKPPVLRGFGGVMFQFSQYPLQVAHLMYQNFAKMGPRGKKAGLFTLLTMFSMSGLLFAIPFGDDAINIFEWLTEKITGKKRDFRLETQQMLVDIFGDGPEAQREAEALLYGPFRALLGINIGERIGFSSMLPEMGDPISAIPALSGTIGKISEYRNRLADQPLAAHAALLSPIIGKGPTDLLRGLVVFPEEGYRTQFGSNIKSPDDMDAADYLGRALGFQSADIARLVRAKRAGEEINTGTRDAETRNTRRLSKMLADAIRLEQKGDQAGADALREEFATAVQEISDNFTAEVEAGNLATAIKPPSSESLREAVTYELYPEMRINSYGKIKRRAILDARRDILMSGEEDFPEMVEDQQQFDSQFEGE